MKNVLFTCKKITKHMYFYEFYNKSFSMMKYTMFACVACEKRSEKKHKRGKRIEYTYTDEVVRSWVLSIEFIVVMHQLRSGFIYKTWNDSAQCMAESMQRTHSHTCCRSSFSTLMNDNTSRANAMTNRWECIHTVVIIIIIIIITIIWNDAIFETSSRIIHHSRQNLYLAWD